MSPPPPSRLLFPSCHTPILLISMGHPIVCSIFLQAASNLSPYLHFGHLSAQRMALLVKAKGAKHSSGVASFLEESIVRRELSDNFCYYQPKYDSLEGAAGEYMSPPPAPPQPRPPPN